MSTDVLDIRDIDYIIINKVLSDNFTCELYQILKEELILIFFQALKKKIKEDGTFQHFTRLAYLHTEAKKRMLHKKKKTID